MKKIYLFMISIISLLVLQDTINAQSLVMVQGDRIRVTTSEYFKAPVIGEFYQMNRDTLFFKLNSSLFSIPLDKIQKLEVSKGQKLNTKNGAIIGGIGVGVASGLLFTLVESSNTDHSGPGVDFSPVQDFFIGAVPGCLIGSLFGGIIGHGITSDIWKNVSFTSH